MKILSALVAAVRRLELPVPSGSKPAAEDGETQQRQREKGRPDAGEQPPSESARRYRILVENTSDIITLMGADGTVYYESAALERVLGYRPEEQVGTNAFDWIHPEDIDRALKLFIDVLGTPGLHPPLEFRVPHKDGSSRYLEHVVNNLLDDPDVGGIVVTSRDITKRKELEEQLRHHAFHDPLTDLPNRALFMNRLEQALAARPGGERPVAVLFLDLDNFKLVNDSLGHEVGDRLLVGVAGRLRASLRPADTVARLGGDEFAILLEDVADQGDAIRAALRVAKRLGPPFSLEGHEVFATTSIGIAFCTSAGSSAENLLRVADRAMYQAKRGGEVYALKSGLGTSGQALRRLELEGDLRRALEREEFRICYQPEIVLENGRTAGMEALVRWEHPERGLLLPSRFVPVAEETGLIVPIGLWVLGAACRQARAWQERYPGGPRPTVWVNLSGKQLQRPKLLDEVAEALQEAGLHPSGLGLEITESVMMEDTRSTIATLRELAALGVRLAIDDFGMGYSSLSALRHFPVQLLKIDRSFVDGLEDDAPEGAAFLSAMIGLARALGMKTVAEGVETGEQAARLREIGCEMAQGTYFSEPLQEEAASELLANNLRP